MPKTDLDFHIGHRDRLRQKVTDGQATDYEKFELALCYLIPRRDVRPLARGLLRDFGGVHQVITAPLDTLVDYPGIGYNTAVGLRLFSEIAMIDYKEQMKDRPIFYDNKTLIGYCQNLLSSKTIEEFHILYLDAQWRLIECVLHSQGTIDWALAIPREIAKRAMDCNASSVIMLHNHPIPRTSFSQQDIEITHAVRAALALLQIELFDHLLVSGDFIYSAKDLHLFK